MEEPLVSIIVPCYNQGRFLDEALSSVLGQTFSYWECIIINDGSTDETEKIAHRWSVKDSRFIPISVQNGGVSRARNIGISRAQGNFILPLDADDKISNDYVKAAISAFQNDPSLKLVYCQAEKFGKVSEPWSLEPFSLLNLTRFNMIFCSAMYKKEDWAMAGGYDDQMTTGIEDWEFWISLLKTGGKVRRLELTGFYYRIQSNGRTGKITDTNLKELYEYMSIKHAEFFVQQLGSFKYLDQRITNLQEEHDLKLTSRKFVIDLFCKRFLNFSIFGTYRL
ncbi:glycosyltransferase family 2 protein [Salinimicrobium sp. TH3]|uniref:glycosyltransferase family 2 protein n=1 Tax=Salinimicrobium sp. TH3 TaxID=2997342 RepID=UPI002274D1C3|nr:glycosyltransferase family A protein [Salinimicrobium sp. TH3]MCY2687853.1 glycosyltransferase family A protein [Salinimicrobium sp. TH3]